MENVEIYFGAWMVGLGTAVEIIQRAIEKVIKKDLPEMGITIVVGLVCIAAAIVGTMLVGTWDWWFFIKGAIFLMCGQFGFDFLIIKKFFPKKK